MNPNSNALPKIAEMYPGISCEVHIGGQPLYPYLFGVE